MKAKITFEVDTCLECPYQRGHEDKLFCSLEKTTDCIWGRVGSTKTVPDWCPFVLKQYLDFISEICESYDWKSYMKANTDNPKNLEYLAFDRGISHAKNTIDYANRFLEDLSSSSIRSFLYGEEFHSVERDKRLTTITCLLRDVGAYESRKNQAKNSAAIAEREFLNHSELSDEDKSIISDAILYWQKGANSIIEFRELKERFKAYKKKPILDTCTAIKVALYLADVLDIGEQRGWHLLGEKFPSLVRTLHKVEKVEYKLVYDKNLGGGIGDNPKNAAELHYTIEPGFELNALKLWPELVAVPRAITSDFLGFRSFKFFVNGEKVNIRRVTG